MANRRAMSLEEQMLRRNLRKQDAQAAAEANQAARDVYSAQRFGQLTDGASRQITSRGVRQRGMSDAEAATQIRQELDNGAVNPGPSTASVPLNPSATVGVGRGRPLSEGRSSSGFRSTLRDPGAGADPYNPTGFRSSNASPGKDGGKFVLRTEAERQARISESPLTVRPRLISSKSDGTGTLINSQDGDFTAEESRMYADRARRGGFGSAKPAPGAGGAMPNVTAPTAAPMVNPSVNRPMDRSGSGQRLANRPMDRSGSGKRIAGAANMNPQRDRSGSGARIASAASAQPTPPPTPTPVPVAPKPTRPRLTKAWTGETQDGSYFSGMKPNAAGRTYRPANWTQDMENQSGRQGRLGNAAASLGTNRLVPEPIAAPARRLATAMAAKQARTVTNPATWKDPKPVMSTIRPPIGIAAARG